ncbi:tetratricopeptide repeat protein [Nitrospirillum sp. BR 11828]|uniref:tetratricopeptide repeat protein n=1 Tax=Nitrospirillum sp. BR 11828 TaxID=3104325 RepID=UPI002ACA23F4|nr:tetratricopeptide repeat protein [Nitrospirillum sp. BR 11828]MDZ5649246.1 tetratricopeptide repeat protein [Nitrospirillum sp. BR 11828]
MATVEDTLKLALDHHDAGRLAEAEALYGRVVAMAPNHVQALYLWGAAAHLRGDHAAALPRLERARYLAPEAAVITVLLAATHRAMGGLATAETLYREVLAAEPRQGEAAAALAEMLEERAKALQARGDAAAALSQEEQAVAVLRTAGLSPKPTLWNSLGTGLLAAGRREEAIAALESAVAANPRYGEALSNLGAALKAAKRLDDAAARYRQALALFPKVPELHTNLGTVLAELNQPAEALAAYQEAVRLNPAFVGGWLNVGMGRHAVDDLEGAADAYRRALALDPSFHRAWTALGAVLYELGRFEEAAAAAERALEIHPSGVEANWNLALVSLLLGRYAKGWPLYEWRRHSRTNPLRTFDRPAWDGAPFPGRTLLVHVEQGLGDVLMVARYLPAVAAMGGRVLLETPPELVDLMQDLVRPGRLELAPTDRPLPPFDLQCPIMSLPGLFKAGISPIPNQVPYLHVDEPRRARWRDRLAQAMAPSATTRQASTQQSLKVALVWAGNPNFTGDRWRSPRLPAFAPVLQVPGVHFFSLQMGDGRRDLAAGPLPAAFTDLAPDIRDFADTAAILMNVDLLISSCTAPVHLAGALGRPVWVVLPRSPDWRWGLGRADSDWYPSARLYRQETRGDWGPVMRQVAAALAARVDPC